MNCKAKKKQLSSDDSAFGLEVGTLVSRALIMGGAAKDGGGSLRF